MGHSRAVIEWGEGRVKSRTGREGEREEEMVEGSTAIS